MLSPYRINPYNTNKRTKKASNTNFDNNILIMTLKDVK